MPRPELRVLTVEVAHPRQAAAFLKLQGVPFREGRDGAFVPPHEASGVALELVG